MSRRCVGPGCLADAVMFAGCSPHGDQAYYACFQCTDNARLGVLVGEIVQLFLRRARIQRLMEVIIVDAGTGDEFLEAVNELAEMARRA